jgi:hypothetical protein
MVVTVTGIVALSHKLSLAVALFPAPSLSPNLSLSLSLSLSLNLLAMQHAQSVHLQRVFKPITPLGRSKHPSQQKADPNVHPKMAVDRNLLLPEILHKVRPYTQAAVF